MKNKDFLTIFISVLAATVFFYGVSAGGALALNNVFTSKYSFGNQSYIGTFDVSNLKEDDAKQLLAEGFQQLEENFNMVLIYQDATAELPVETITYDVEQTADLAETGLENPIETTVNEEALGTFLNQQFETVYFEEEDVRNIAEGVESVLETGIMPSKVYISDLMQNNDLAKEQIAQTNLTLGIIPKGLDRIVQSVNDLRIEPFTTFSLLEYLESQDVGLVHNESLTLVASALYQSILQTNFAIEERSIGQALHPDVPIGYEASINQSLGIDFVFTNPNKSAFTLNLAVNGQQLTSSFIGLPFVYTYETTVSPIAEFKPPTVEQFSAMVSKYEKKIAQEGQNGQEVTVTRFAFDKGIELGQEVVSTDYYAPIPRIEILPLKEEELEASGNDTDSSSDNESDATIDSNDHSSSNSSDGSNNNSDGASTSGSNNNQPNNNQSNESNNGQLGNDSNDDESEVQYDKGGNVIE